MSLFHFRRATPEDAETLSHIGVATFVESYTNDIQGSAMMAHCTHEHSPKRYRDYLADHTTKSWIMEHSQTRAPVGYALSCLPDLPIPPMTDDIELKRIYLLSKLHGYGLAQGMLQAAIDCAREDGARRMLLGTYEGNHRAMAFYTKQGFSKIGTRKFKVGHEIFDDIIMAKTL